VKVLVDTSGNTREHDNSDWDRMGDDEHHKPDSSIIWEDLNVKAGIYDILTLRNGVDTLLAAANIKAGSIRLIRIDLGANNSLVKDSVTYPLNLPPGARSYVIIKLKGDEWEEYRPGSSRLWLDFDVARSIIQINNQFYLKPVFHFFTKKNTGSIYGKVLPRDAYPVVSVYNSTDTAYAIPWKAGESEAEEGEFKVRGLKDGQYSVFFNASNGYKDTIINNITISGSENVSVGTITLHK